MSSAILACSAARIASAKPAQVATSARRMGAAQAAPMMGSIKISARANHSHITRVAGNMMISLEDEDWEEDWEDEYEEEDDWLEYGQLYTEATKAQESHYEQQVQARRSRAGNSYSFHGGKKGWGAKNATASAKAYKGQKKSKKALSRSKPDGEVDLFGLDQGGDDFEASYAY